MVDATAPLAAPLMTQKRQQQQSPPLNQTNGATTVTKIELYNAGASWQPVYISVCLTIVQIIFFATIFEVFRRRPRTRHLYDRRRRAHPKRTPPPLPMKIGSWFFFRITKLQQQFKIAQFQAKKSDIDRKKRKSSVLGDTDDTTREGRRGRFGLKRSNSQDELPIFSSASTGTDDDLEFNLGTTDQEAATGTLKGDIFLEDAKEFCLRKSPYHDDSVAVMPLKTDKPPPPRRLPPQRTRSTSTDSSGPQKTRPRRKSSASTATKTNHKKRTRSNSVQSQFTTSSRSTAPSSSPPNTVDAEEARTFPTTITNSSKVRRRSEESWNGEGLDDEVFENEGVQEMRPEQCQDHGSDIKNKHVDQDNLQLEAATAESSGDLDLDDTAHRKNFRSRLRSFAEKSRLGLLVRESSDRSLKSEESEKSAGRGWGLRRSLHRSESGDTQLRTTSAHDDKRRRLRQRKKEERGNLREIPYATQETLNILQRYSELRPKAASLSEKVAWFIRHRILMIRDRKDAPKRGHHTDAGALVTQKISRRPLTNEQAELLRCVGLDAFMTLRFLQVGMGISFWPFVLACATLIPSSLTADSAVRGYFRLSAAALQKGSPRFWLVLAFGYVYFGYVMRRWWVEWEVFLPLRYDFLENGDFEIEKHRDQYRRTCLIEFVPRSHRHDKTLRQFFEATFPDQVVRAEVLLDIEYLRWQLEERLKYIIAYEDRFARMVHERAQYLRRVDSYEKGKQVRCLRRPPNEPEQRYVTVVEDIPYGEWDRALDRVRGTVKQTQTFELLQWYHRMIQKLNQEIDEEYLRLAKEQRRAGVYSESLLSKFLGIGYLFRAETGRLHSTTAFVEFKTLASKQEAIQCNLTGCNHFLEVHPVPEVREILWENAHISRALILIRLSYANMGLTGALIAWSLLVRKIRTSGTVAAYANSLIDYNSVNELVGYDASASVSALLDFYLPAVIVEILVRCIPLLLQVVCRWIRFKSEREIVDYTLRWYFLFRLLTFLAVLLSGDLVDSSIGLAKNPIGFLRKLSGDVPRNAQFFSSYALVTGGITIFAELSQALSVMTHIIHHVGFREEAVSQRRLDKMREKIQVFHHDEFIPLFIFIFMVGALYASIVPFTGLFVSFSFLCAHKVFRFMVLYVYDNKFQGGGFLFYTINSILFYVLYLIILLITGYLSIQATPAISAVFSLLLPMTAVIHWKVHRTFVVPSKTLSLAMARASDAAEDTRPLKEKVYDAYMKAKQDYDKVEQAERAALMQQQMQLKRNREGRGRFGDMVDPKMFVSARTLGANSTGNNKDVMNKIMPFLLHVQENDLQSEDGLGEASGDVDHNRDQQRQGVSFLEMKYCQVDPYDGFSDLSDEDGASRALTSVGLLQNSKDFFIYRQPSLNRRTWEVEPRPYRNKTVSSATETWHASIK